MIAKAEKTLRTKLDYLLTDLIPHKGLHFLGAAERVARIYYVLGERDKARDFFLVAAEQYQPNLPQAIDFRSTVHCIGRSLHAAVLYVLADETEKAVQMCKDVVANSLNVLKNPGNSYPTLIGTVNFDLALAYLIMGRYEDALNYLHSFLADIKYYEGKIATLDRTVLSMFLQFLQAKNNRDKKLLTSIIENLRQYIDSKRRIYHWSIDTAARVTERDILVILQKAGA